MTDVPSDSASGTGVAFDTTTSSGESIDVCSPGTDQVLSDIEYLSRSHNRLKILEHLRCSAMSSTELKHQLGISRTTVRRNLIEMEEKHWIQSSATEDEYRITPPGKFLIEKFNELVKTGRMASDLGTFLRRFPVDVPSEPDCLRACRITCPESHDPHAPSRRFLELLDQTDTIKWLTPSLSLIHVQPLIERIATVDSFEIVSRPSTFEHVQSHRPALADTILEADTGQLFVSEETPEYELGFMDDTIVLVAYDGDMRRHSILEANTERENVVEWAEEQYETYRRAAESHH